MWGMDFMGFGPIYHGLLAFRAEVQQFEWFSFSLLILAFLSAHLLTPTRLTRCRSSRPARRAPPHGHILSHRPLAAARLLRSSSLQPQPAFCFLTPAADSRCDFLIFNSSFWLFCNFVCVICREIHVSEQANVNLDCDL